MYYNVVFTWRNKRSLPTCSIFVLSFISVKICRALILIIQLIGTMLDDKLYVN